MASIGQRLGATFGVIDGLLAAGCQDSARMAMVTTRCETLLDAQERADLPPALRRDPRSTILRRIRPGPSDGDRTVFVRRSYNRVTVGDAGPVVEARDGTCTFDKRIDKAVTLSTNGHRQEMRFGEAEWAAARQ